MYKNEENFMSNVIIKATNDQLSQMKAYYRSYLLNKQNPYYKNFPLRKLPATNASTFTELRNDSHNRIKEETEGRNEGRKEV